jgi:hypothetical protein
MWQASRSLGRSLLIAAALAPACALAGIPVSVTPPAGIVPPPAKAMQPARAVPVKSARVVHSAKAMPPAQAKVAGKYAPPALKTPHTSRTPPIRPRPIEHAHRGHRARKALPRGAIVVSTQGLNRFVFPAAVVKGPIFPADAPVLGAPVYLDANRQLLVQFVPGSDKPFEMVVELSGHQVESFLLAPRNVAGITYHAHGVSPPPERKKPAATADNAHRGQIALLRSVVMGEVPDSFYPAPLPPAARFNKFDIVPRASWSDGSGHRILEYALESVSGQAAVVAAPEFYHKGMAAILLSGEVVDATHSPLLYILEGTDRG